MECHHIVICPFGNYNYSFLFHFVAFFFFVLLNYPRASIMEIRGSRRKVSTSNKHRDLVRYEITSRKVYRLLFCGSVYT